jgi:thioredoxin-dependent peroxiredoxin
VFGVSVDSVADNKAFREKFQYPFPLLSDLDRSCSLAFGAVAATTDQYAQRYTFVIGANAIIEQAIATKDPGGQAAALLATL